MRISEGLVMIPPELIVYMLGAIGLFLTFCIHLLIRISAKQSDMRSDFRVWKAEADLRFLNLENRSTHEKL